MGNWHETGENKEKEELIIIFCFFFKKREMENQNELRIKFDSFVNQNIESVMTHSQNMPSHPVNREALEVWRSQMTENIMTNQDLKNDRKHLIEWTNRFADNLTCVSHEEFLNTFDKIVDDLIIQLKKTSYKSVILCMEYNADKSSVWLSILCWKKIQQYVTHVMTFTDANNYLYYEKNACVIYPDDAMYSGTQYTDNYRTIHRNVNDITHFCLVPYISETAFDKFKNNIWISDYSVKFKPLYKDDEKNLQILSSNIVVNLISIFCGEIDSVIPNKHVLYFDHKLADQLSLYTKVIAYSLLLPSKGLNVDDIEFGKGFITNCDRSEVNVQSYKKFLLYGTCKPLCPRPVYKYLSYTFNDKKVETGEALLSFLKVNTYMCYNCTQEAKYVCSRCLNQVFCGKKCQINCHF